MGVIQNSLVGMMNTLMGGLAASKFVKGQQEGNEINAQLVKAKEIEGLQQEYLQNKGAIDYNIEEGNKAYETLTAPRKQTDDLNEMFKNSEEIENAKKSIISSQQKISAVQNMNNRVVARIKELDSLDNLIGYEDKPMDKLKEGKK